MTSRTPPSRLLTLRRPDTCVGCRQPLAAGTRGWWDPSARAVTCSTCHTGSAAAATPHPAPPPVPSHPPEPAPIDRGVPGASAQRVYEQRRHARDKRTQRQWGPLSGLVAAVSSEPAHQVNWARGAHAEREIARRLERQTADRAILLHDRRKPGSTANIDHIAISSAGVFVIDAKRYKGKIATTRTGGLLRPSQSHLIIAGRDRSALLEAVLEQARLVERLLATNDFGRVPVWPIMCFLDAEMRLFTRAARGVALCGPNRAARLINAEGPIESEAGIRIARILAERLPAAAR